MRKLTLLRIDELKAHESTIRERVEELKEEIEKSGVLKKPVLVDEGTKVILDGHHRVQALRELGCHLVPVILVNYKSEDICVVPWRDCDKIVKEDVIRAGLTGKLLPPKTSRHLIICDGCRRHVEYIEGKHSIPINILRPPSKEDLRVITGYMTGGDEG